MCYTFALLSLAFSPFSNIEHIKKKHNVHFSFHTYNVLCVVRLKSHFSLYPAILSLLNVNSNRFRLLSFHPTLPPLHAQTSSLLNLLLVCFYSYFILYSQSLLYTTYGFFLFGVSLCSFSAKFTGNKNSGALCRARSYHEPFLGPRKA